MRLNAERLVVPLRRHGQLLIQVMVLLVHDMEYVEGTQADGKLDAATLKIGIFLGLEPASITPQNFRDLVSNLERLARQGLLRADNFGKCSGLVAEHKTLQTTMPAEVCQTLERVEKFVKLCIQIFGTGPNLTLPRTPTSNKDAGMMVVTEASLEEETDSASPKRKVQHLFTTPTSQFQHSKNAERSYSRPRIFLADVLASVKHQNMADTRANPKPNRPTANKEHSSLELSGITDALAYPCETPDIWQQKLRPSMNSRLPSSDVLIKFDWTADEVSAIDPLPKEEGMASVHCSSEIPGFSQPADCKKSCIEGKATDQDPLRNRDDSLGRYTEFVDLKSFKSSSIESQAEATKGSRKEKKEDVLQFVEKRRAQKSGNQEKQSFHKSQRCDASPIHEQSKCNNNSQRITMNGSKTEIKDRDITKMSFRSQVSGKKMCRLDLFERNFIPSSTREKLASCSNSRVDQSEQNILSPSTGLRFNILDRLHHRRLAAPITTSSIHSSTILPVANPSPSNANPSPVFCLSSSILYKDCTSLNKPTKLMQSPRLANIRLSAGAPKPTAKTPTHRETKSGLSDIPLRWFMLEAKNKLTSRSPVSAGRHTEKPDRQFLIIPQPQVPKTTRHRLASISVGRPQQLSVRRHSPSSPRQSITVSNTLQTLRQLQHKLETAKNSILVVRPSSKSPARRRSPATHARPL